VDPAWPAGLWWSPPPESNRRPHPYHRWSARSGDNAAPRSTLENYKWPALSMIEKWGAARRYAARLLANHWHACGSFVAWQGQVEQPCKTATNCPGVLVRVPSGPETVSIHAARADPNRQILSLVLCVDLVGSRPVCPAQVGCLVDPDGSRRNPSDHLDDRTDDKGHPTQNRMVRRPASRALGQRWQVALLVGPTLSVQACRDWRGRRRGEC
jgi:hypothetical protein